MNSNIAEVRKQSNHEKVEKHRLIQQRRLATALSLVLFVANWIFYSISFKHYSVIANTLTVITVNLFCLLASFAKSKEIRFRLILVTAILWIGFLMQLAIGSQVLLELETSLTWFLLSSWIPFSVALYCNYFWVHCNYGGDKVIEKEVARWLLYFFYIASSLFTIALAIYFTEMEVVFWILPVYILNLVAMHLLTT